MVVTVLWTHQIPLRAGEMAPWVRALATKTDNQPIFNTWNSWDRKRQLIPNSCPLTPTRTPWHAYIHICTHTKDMYTYTQWVHFKMFNVLLIIWDSHIMHPDLPPHSNCDPPPKKRPFCVVHMLTGTVQTPSGRPTQSQGKMYLFPPAHWTEAIYCGEPCRGWWRAELVLPCAYAVSARGGTNSLASHSTACASMTWLLERVWASPPASIPQLALRVVAEEGWGQLRTADRHQRDFSWQPRPHASAMPSVVILTTDISMVFGRIRTMGDSWPSVSAQTWASTWPLVATHAPAYAMFDFILWVLYQYYFCLFCWVFVCLFFFLR